MNKEEGYEKESSKRRRVNGGKRGKAKSSSVRRGVYMYVGRVIRNRPEEMRRGKKDRREMVKWRAGSALNVNSGERKRIGGLSGLV